MNTVNKEPKFYNFDGSLTKYALACGYCEKEGKGENRKTLYQEHCTYHVTSTINGKIEWFAFDKNELTKARKKFKSISLN